MSFVREVTERLPRIERLAARVPQDLDAVRRDVHTLASSAWVVEERELSQLARAVEDDLVGGPVSELVARLQALVTAP